MTKLEFIEALHHACPAFMRDLRSSAKLIGSMKSLRSEAAASLSDETLPDPLTEVKRLEVEFQNRWPKWPHYLSDPPPILREPNHFDFDSLMEGLEIFNQAKAANVELDPVLAYRGVFQFISSEKISEKLPENSLEKQWQLKASKEMILELNTNNEMKENLRRGAGEFLFRNAAIVIPVYAYTNKDDIDWEVVEQLKKRFYGQSYRSKTELYEKIIKVFQRGQLLEEQAGKEEIAYKSWQEVADSVGLRLNTVRYIYNKAHLIVYGESAKKRRYGTEEEITVPESVEDIPEDPGPSLRERLIDTRKELGEFRRIFDDDLPEICHRCRQTSSDGRYDPHPERPDDEIFTCTDCLSPAQ